jgi:hypothetical protein
MAVELNDLIQIHEKNIEPNDCELLIDTFNSYSNGTYLNLTDNRDVTTEVSTIHQKLIKTVMDIRDSYYETCYLEVFPENHAFEKFSILKYDPEVVVNSNTRVDVKSYGEARRFLCFKWFLNSNSGGHINFLDLSIQPEVGKLILYPPLWMFPYREEPPVETPKYILTTYLHYK